MGERPDTSRGPRRKRQAAALWRPVLFVLGWVLLALGVAGVFLPLVPGTLFLILSAACFARSSPRFEAWLLAHPQLGPPVRQWRERGAIPRRIKLIACASLVASWLLILWTAPPDAIKVGCLALFVGVAGFIVTRPEL